MFRFVRRFHIAGTTYSEGKDLSQQHTDLPSRSQIVVCGGGIVGSSVAFHLPQFGFKDIVHLDQGKVCEMIVTL